MIRNTNMHYIGDVDGWTVGSIRSFCFWTRFHLHRPRERRGRAKVASVASAFMLRFRSFVGVSTYRSSVRRVVRIGQEDRRGGITRIESIDNSSTHTSPCDGRTGLLSVCASIGRSISIVGRSSRSLFGTRRLMLRSA